jgi:recombination protein RecA
MGRTPGSKNKSEGKESIDKVKGALTNEQIVAQATSDTGYIEPNKDKMNAVMEAMKQIEKEFGKGSVIKLGDQPAIRTEVIPTGAMSLDIALGVGGLPKGRIIEVIGPESSGKSTLALQIIAEAQKLGGICAYIDAENAMDKEYASKIGVDTDNLFLTQPDYGEQGLAIAEKFVRSGGIDLIVVDSVAALLPKVELDGEIGDQHMGLQARMMGQAMRKLTAVLNKSKTTIIFINQIREKIGIAFGNPEVSPGGRALKFYASVRIDIRRKDAIKEGDKVIGNHIVAKVVKNKVAPPFTRAEFDIIFGKGVDKESAILGAAEACGVVTKSGSWYFYGKEKIGQGQGGTVEYLRKNKEKLDNIGKDTMAKSIKLVDAVEVNEAEVNEDVPEMPEEEIKGIEGAKVEGTEKKEEFL